MRLFTFLSLNVSDVTIKYENQFGGVCYGIHFAFKMMIGKILGKIFKNITFFNGAVIVTWLENADHYQTLKVGDKTIEIVLMVVI